MQIPLTPLVVVLFAVIAQAVFAAGLLWLARANQLPNRFLALLMLAIALWLLDGFFRVASIYAQDPNWYFAPIYYSLAFGPLLYFYVRSLVNHDFRWRPRYWWHFAPVLVQAALYAWLRGQDYEARNWFWQHVHRPYTYRLEFIGTWISLTAYLVLSLRLLREYRRWLLNNFSEVSQLRLLWLRTLLVLVGVVSAQWLLELVLREFFQLYYRFDYSTELLGVVVFLIGVVGLRQADMQAVRFEPEEVAPSVASAAPIVVPTRAATEPPSSIAVPFPEVYATEELPAAPPAHEVTPPPATPAVDPLVVERIRRALQDERLYLNPTLTLAELSAHTGLAPRLISFTVNNGFGQSFNDLVNGYRVTEVKRRLATPDAQRLTLLGIAFESGFNSKTTFNRIFKQFTGVAPRDFKVTE
ncbi:helix-turn-helix domain-containing protein [Hymenobacter sp. BT186]|uniref:Helix-turn-helix domain-containing protein n=1 Tax=Hymenobacter telluris TaxID=2816474 RepID=A0A939EXJ0_9BACT|nr:helix-turn-helix domain-containing protein [Hymenobacter telluris]MBO0358851.1 helix-turn-helix domain-containing protein [Hymenobacter telluris]MBW3374877.1 helix-turn-helix domain-containing protein [Hymenobacter norwichensis]